MDQNCMNHIKLQDTKVLGSKEWPGGLDLINIVMIGLATGLPEQDKQYGLHRLLTASLSGELSKEEKLDILEKEYQIPVNDEMREDVNVMCNLNHRGKSAQKQGAGSIFSPCSE